MPWKFPFFWSTIRLNVNTLCFFCKIQYANYSLHVVRQISTFSYLLFYEACRFSFVIFPRWVNLLSLREINVVSIKVNYASNVRTARPFMLSLVTFTCRINLHVSFLSVISFKSKIVIEKVEIIFVQPCYTSEKQQILCHSFVI